MSRGTKLQDEGNQPKDAKIADPTITQPDGISDRSLDLLDTAGARAFKVPNWNSTDKQMRDEE